MAINASEEITLPDPDEVAASEFLCAVGSGIDGEFYKFASEGLLVEVDAEVVYEEVELWVQYGVLRVSVVDSVV